MNVGDLVRVKRQHWARGGQPCTVEALDSEDGDYVLVRFERKGIGFDGGHYLRLNQIDLEDA